MTDPQETTSSSPSLSLWPGDQPVPVSTLVPSLREMAASLAQDTMVPQQVLPTALILRRSRVSARYTLKPMSLHTQRVMGLPLRVHQYTQPIHPATLARVSSLMREYRPWYSIDSIEIRLVSDFSQT